MESKLLSTILLSTFPVPNVCLFLIQFFYFHYRFGKFKNLIVKVSKTTEILAFSNLAMHALAIDVDVDNIIDAALPSYDIFNC